MGERIVEAVSKLKGMRTSPMGNCNGKLRSLRLQPNQRRESKSRHQCQDHDESTTFPVSCQELHQATIQEHLKFQASLHDKAITNVVENTLRESHGVVPMFLAV